jgi:hypothetical protein
MRKAILSGACVLLSWSLALAQPMPPQPPQPLPPKPPLVVKTPPKTGVEKAIEDALVNHPDVRVAEAKKLVASAELDQAKLLVAQRVTTAYSKVEHAKSALRIAEVQLDTKKRLLDSKVGSIEDIREAESKYIAAKVAIETAEAELRAATGGDQKAALTEDERKLFEIQRYVELAYSKYQRVQVAPTPTPASEQLTRTLEKTLKLDTDGGELARIMEQLVEASGSKSLNIRGLDAISGKMMKDPPKIDALKGEHSVAAWLQMCLDELNYSSANLPQNLKGKYDFYVREYGLLVAKTENAPKDAITLTAFMQQMKKPKETEKK